MSLNHHTDVVWPILGVILAVTSVLHVLAQTITGRYTISYRHWIFILIGLSLITIGTAVVSITTVQALMYIYYE